MYPLVNTANLAHLIVGFGFEQIFIDSLVEEFKNSLLRDSEYLPKA